MSGELVILLSDYLDGLSLWCICLCMICSISNTFFFSTAGLTAIMVEPEEKNNESELLTMYEPGMRERNDSKSYPEDLVKRPETPMDTETLMGSGIMEETRPKKPGRDCPCEGSRAGSPLEKPNSLASGDSDSGDLNLLSVSVEKVALSHCL